MGFFPVIRSVETERPQTLSPSYGSVETDRSVELNQDDEGKCRKVSPSATLSVRYTPQEPKLCLQHRMPLEIHCKTDQILICKRCATVEHQGHNKRYAPGARVRQKLSVVFRAVVQLMQGCLIHQAVFHCSLE